MQTVIAPLRVLVTKKKYFVLNMNQYRNAHYFTLNKAKQVYKEALEAQILALSSYSKIHVTFTLYPRNRRLTDLSNVLSIHDKFFMDALVEAGKLPDDTYIEVGSVDYRFGEIDKNEPRVEITITEVV